MTPPSSDLIGGCLGLHWEKWGLIGAEIWVIKLLQEGYQIPFVSPPPLRSQPPDSRRLTSLSLKGRALHQELQLLWDKGAIEPASASPGFYSHVFVVPKASGGFRPIIDLSILNSYVSKTKFKMETARTVMAAIQRDDWMVSLDLKDAYLQVPVHPDSRRFLRFLWQGSPFQFRALCFGLSTAPQVFTRLMAPVSAEFHRRGFRLLRYLDDWLVLASSQIEAQEATTCLLNLCSDLGIRVNWEKSSLSPEQKKTFLGMSILSPKLLVFPTEERIRNLQDAVLKFLSSKSPPASLWLRLLGLMASLIHLVPGSRKRTRKLQIVLNRHWCGHRDPEDLSIAWDAECLQDLEWWRDARNLRQGQPLQQAVPDFFLYTDASCVGWGASLLHDSVSGLWSLQDSALHINLLELRAIRLGLLHFQDVLASSVVAVFSDNTTALAYLSREGGTHSAALNQEARLILDWADANRVKILTQFVRGSINVVADSLSRRHQIISTEWTLHQEVCNQLWRVWGYPTVDLFATRLNFRLPNFVSPFPDPLAIATDAFLFCWDNQDLYAFPPLPLVRRVINKLRLSHNTTLILIAPYWPQKEWFPDLVSASIEPPRLLPFRPDLLRQPHCHRFHLGLHELQLTGWKLSNAS